MMIMRNLIKWKKGVPTYINYIRRQVNERNCNFIALFQGGPGTGKTWSAISLGELIDPEFDVDKHLVFDFKGMMQLINSEDFKKKKMKISPN